MVMINKKWDIPDSACVLIITPAVARRIVSETSGTLMEIFVQLFSYLGSSVIVQTDEEVRRSLVAIAQLESEHFN